MRSLGRPDDPPSRFALTIFWINGLLMRNGEAITKTLGLSSAKWQVLGRAGDKPQTVAQMARDMGLARQSVQRVADVLEKQKLVTYRHNLSDHRAQLVELTEQGEQALAAIYRQNEDWSRQIASKLDLQRLAKVTDEVARIGRILEKNEQTEKRRGL
jgi:DNA-binding MarR family transcriptional regulator